MDVARFWMWPGFGVPDLVVRTCAKTWSLGMEHTRIAPIRASVYKQVAFSLSYERDTDMHTHAEGHHG